MGLRVLLSEAHRSPVLSQIRGCLFGLGLPKTGESKQFRTVCPLRGAHALFGSGLLPFHLPVPAARPKILLLPVYGRGRRGGGGPISDHELLGKGRGSFRKQTGPSPLGAPPPADPAVVARDGQLLCAPFDSDARRIRLGRFFACDG